MKYEEILELLPDYVKGRLGDDLSAKVAAEIEGTAALQREVDRLKAYFEAMEQVEDVQAPGDFVNRVNASINAQSGPVGVLRRLFFPLHIKLPLEAAGLAVTLLLVVMVFNPFTLENVPQEVLTEPTATRAVPAPRYEPNDAAEYDEFEAVDEDQVAGRKDEKKMKPAKGKAQPDIAPASVADPVADEPAVAYAPEPEAEFKQDAEVLRSADKAGSSSGVGRSRRSKEKRRSAPKSKAAAAPPPPAAKPASRAEESVSHELASGAMADDRDVALQRRQVREEREAISVMALVVNDRDIDGSGVKSNRRSRAKKTEAMGESASFMYESKAHKAWAIVERSVKSRGGSYRVRSTVLSPTPRRVYTISISASKFGGVRADLKALGVLRDIDLNLDAASTQRISFKLSVTVD